MHWSARVPDMVKRRMDLDVLPLVTLRGMIATMNAAILPNVATFRLPAFQRFVFSILRHEYPLIPSYVIDWDCSKLEEQVKAFAKYELSQA